MNAEKHWVKSVKRRFIKGLTILLFFPYMHLFRVYIRVYGCEMALISERGWYYARPSLFLLPLKCLSVLILLHLLQNGRVQKFVLAFAFEWFAFCKRTFVNYLILTRNPFPDRVLICGNHSNTVNLSWDCLCLSLCLLPVLISILKAFGQDSPYIENVQLILHLSMNY